MKTVYVIFILIVIPLMVNAQGIINQHSEISPQFRELWQSFKGEQLNDGVQYANYKGRPHLFESTSALIIFNEKKKAEGLTIRYNVYNDLMEIKNGNNYYNLPKGRVVPEVHLDKHVFVLKKYKIANTVQLGYFECVLEDEKCCLFLKHKVLLKEAEVAQPFQEARPAEFKKQAPTAYITNNEAFLLPVYNKKDFMELISDNHDEMVKYIKKNKTKFRKPESVKQLVEYYNSL